MVKKIILRPSSWPKYGIVASCRCMQKLGFLETFLRLPIWHLILKKYGSYFLMQLSSFIIIENLRACFLDANNPELTTWRWLQLEFHLLCFLYIELSSRTWRYWPFVSNFGRETLDTILDLLLLYNRILPLRLP